MAKIYKPGMTLEELARLAKGRYSAKEETAKASYNAMKSTMKSNYGKLPFGPTRKSNYEKRIETAVLRFDPDKWESHYVAKMRL